MSIDKSDACVDTQAELEERFGPGSELAAMVRAINAPPRPPPNPREPDPPVVWQSARHRLLAEALSDAYDGCCGDSSGADGWHERAAELLAELDAMGGSDEG